ncbi:4023_t:CDS:2, partial [Dentiscutata erythropus]
MEDNDCGDLFKSLCFQYPCEYGAECSSYHLEPDNEVLYRDTEILDEASVDSNFDTWDLVDKFLDDYTKQEGFTVCKKRRTLDAKDSTIIRRQIYKYSYA